MCGKFLDMPSMTPASLTAHAKKMLPRLLKDAVLSPEPAKEVREQLLASIQAWDGGAVPPLFARAPEPWDQYAVASVVATAPGFSLLAPLDLPNSKVFTQSLSVAVSHLTVKGPLELSEGRTLVVFGKLDAPSILVDEDSGLIVVGDVKTRVAAGSGWILVGGDLTADAVLGEYPAGELRVAGTLRSPLAIFLSHGNRIGQKDVGHYVSAWDGDEKGQEELAALTALLVPTAVKRGSIDLKALRKLVAAGRSVMR